MASLGLQRLGVGGKQEQSGTVEISRKASLYAESTRIAQDLSKSQSHDNTDEESAIIQEMLQFSNEIEKNIARLKETVVRNSQQKEQVDASIKALESMQAETLESISMKGYSGVNIKSLSNNRTVQASTFSQTGQQLTGHSIKSIEKSMGHMFEEKPQPQANLLTQSLSSGESRLLADQLLELESLRVRMERLKETVGGVPSASVSSHVDRVSHSFKQDREA